MSDLIARLQGPFLPSANGAYDGGIRLPLEARQELMDAAAIRIEAAAALEAKDAKIAKAQEDYEWASQSCAAWRKDYDELQGTLGETTLRYTTEIAAL
ncbi:MAG: hypothetical protein KGL35_28235, partial [Bradyrhizobium sp.]|nr:hypothetical protein [Bradyrhizobium sp.]